MIDKEIIKSVCKDEEFIRVIEYDMQKAVKEIWADWNTDTLYYEFKDGTAYESPMSVVLDYLNTLKLKGH
jgi:hypothetical protein